MTEAMSERLGKYELLSKLATGGMAEIYLARADAVMGVERTVVIKKLLPKLAEQSDFVEMFLDEARIAASLSHPNIVQMSDFGKVGGSCFMAMEYLHGQDLSAIRRALSEKGRTLPLEQAVTIAAGICAALQHAHEART